MQTDISRLHDIWKEMFEQGLVYDKKLFHGINDAFLEADRRVGAAQIFYDFGMGTPNRALRAIRDEIIDQKTIRIDPDEAEKLIDHINTVINQHPDWEMGPREWRARGMHDDESRKKLEDAFHGMLVFNPEIARRIGAPLPGEPNKGCQPTASLIFIFVFATWTVFLRAVLNK